MKGGEDDNIVVIEDMGTAFFNQFTKGTPQNKDEVTRMFYTGITRVKEKLFILSLGTGSAFPFKEIFSELDKKFKKVA
jgi:superfamily I DNA/RNA helicase